MKLAMIVLMLGLIAPAVAAGDTAFDPFPGNQKIAYRFDLKKMYADPAAWKTDVEKVRSLAGKLEGMRGKLLNSPDDLLAALEVQSQAEDTLVKLYAYGEFREAINTDDRGPYDDYERLRAEYDSRTSFFDAEMRGLSHEKLEAFLKAQPKLVPFRFLLDDTVRMTPYTLPEQLESLLAKLGPDLTSWQPALFQATFDRTRFPKVAADGKEYDAYRDFDTLLEHPDRNVREQAFKGTYRTFEQISDLLGFSLLKEMTTYNELAKLRGFDNYYGEQLFRRYLTRPQVENLFGQIAMRQPIYGAYQTGAPIRSRRPTGSPRRRSGTWSFPSRARSLRASRQMKAYASSARACPSWVPNTAGNWASCSIRPTAAWTSWAGPSAARGLSARATSATSWATTRACWRMWPPWRTNRATPFTTASWRTPRDPSTSA